MKAVSFLILLCSAASVGWLLGQSVNSLRRLRNKIHRQEKEFPRPTDAWNFTFRRRVNGTLEVRRRVLKDEECLKDNLSPWLGVEVRQNMSIKLSVRQNFLFGIVFENGNCSGKPFFYRPYYNAYWSSRQPEEWWWMNWQPVTGLYAGFHMETNVSYIGISDTLPPGEHYKCDHFETFYGKGLIVTFTTIEGDRRIRVGHNQPFATVGGEEQTVLAKDLVPGHHVLLGNFPGTGIDASLASVKSVVQDKEFGRYYAYKCFHGVVHAQGAALITQSIPSVFPTYLHLLGHVVGQKRAFLWTTQLTAWLLSKV